MSIFFTFSILSAIDCRSHFSLCLIEWLRTKIGYGMSTMEFEHPQKLRKCSHDMISC